MFMKKIKFAFTVIKIFMKKIFAVILLISMIFSMSVMVNADPETGYEKLGASTINVINENEISK